MNKIFEFLKNRIIILIGVVILIVIAIFLLNNPFNKEDSSITTNTIFLKLNIPIGGESEARVKITNSKEEQLFNARLANLISIGSVDEESFTLGTGESKHIKLFFKDTKKEAVIYAGQLIIESSESKKTIPIILNVEDRTSQFVIIHEVIQKYEEVYPGGKLGMKIKLYNVENNDLENVKVSYIIKNLDDEIISSEEENLAIKGNIEINKIIDMPATLSQGNYIFITSLDSNGVKTSAGYLFSVTNQKREVSSSDNFNIFIIVIMVFLVGIVFLFFYFIKTRDDLLIQLKKQQTSELEKNLELIESHRRELSNLKGERKEKKIRELKVIKKVVIKKIKEKQHRQRKELKKLKKQGKKSVIARKMQQWNREGYKMFELKKEKIIPNSSISKQISNWQKEGYNTNILRK